MSVPAVFQDVFLSPLYLSSFFPQLKWKAMQSCKQETRKQKRILATHQPFTALDALQSKDLSSGPASHSRRVQLACPRATQSKGWPLSGKFQWDVSCGALHSAPSLHTSVSGRAPGTHLLPALVVPPLVCGSGGLLRPVSTTYTTLFCAGSRHLFLHLWVKVLQAHQ